ncbi:unnamed protein product [Owenia fusiformis]|uniref:Uncharacterized protein n=1 Tax=Owenia fusiformis TaxID=6347 RepID=A0A8S4P8Z9_OWEFU|nr:unnamed protein product [Owenia fusiformis]
MVIFCKQIHVSHSRECYTKHSTAHCRESEHNCPYTYWCSDSEDKACCQDREITKALIRDEAIRDENGEVKSCINEACPKGQKCTSKLVEGYERYKYCVPSSSGRQCYDTEGQLHTTDIWISKRDRCNKCRCRRNGKRRCSMKSSCRKCNVTLQNRENRIVRRGFEFWKDKCTKCMCKSKKIIECEETCNKRLPYINQCSVCVKDKNYNEISLCCNACYGETGTTTDRCFTTNKLEISPLSAVTGYKALCGECGAAEQAGVECFNFTGGCNGCEGYTVALKRCSRFNAQETPECSNIFYDCMKKACFMARGRQLPLTDSDLGGICSDFICDKERSETKENCSNDCSSDDLPCQHK